MGKPDHLLRQFWATDVELARDAAEAYASGSRRAGEIATAVGSEHHIKLAPRGEHRCLLGKHGATCDNLLGTGIVTADCKMLHASAAENSDLLWACAAAAISGSSPRWNTASTGRPKTFDAKAGTAAQSRIPV